MRRRLDDPGRVAEVTERLARLSPDSARRWGTMTPAAMLCHLSDAFEMALGERETGAAETLFSRTVMKWVAVELPVRWPHGVRTLAAMDPARRGTRPTSLDTDRRRLEGLMIRFVELDGAPDVRHPLFGRLDRGPWMRWGWRHVDHHLRQFGV